MSNILNFKVQIKAIHSRPDKTVPEEECALKVSLQPIRLNVDQVSNSLINICT
jgi:hypothetical protein